MLYKICSFGAHFYVTYELIEFRVVFLHASCFVVCNLFMMESVQLPKYVYPNKQREHFIMN